MTDKQFGTQIVESQPAQKNRRKGLQRTLWIAGPLLVVLIAGWIYVTSGRYVSTDNAYVNADQANISAQVAGRVVEVAVQENQRVHKGDVLFRIDPEPFQLSVDALQAQMQAIGDYLASSRDSYAAATADLRSQQASLTHDLAQLQRIDDLRAKGLAAQKDLDDAANDVATSRGKRDTAAANAAKSKTLLGGDVDTPVQQLSGYKAIEAQMAKAQLDLEHATVLAPMDGVIGKTSLQPGDFVQVGQAVMPLIGNTAWVDANFKETDLTNVAVGQKARITLDTYPDYTWDARVVSISPASGASFSVLPAQNATGNWVKVVQRIPVRLQLQVRKDAPVARVGMSAEVEIDTGASHSLWGRWFGGGDAGQQAKLDKR